MPVVLYHAGVSVVSGGFVGVDVFFVISGFLITSLISQEITQGKFSIFSFYERRARRILPVLFVVLAVTLVVGTVVLLPSDLHGLTRSAAASALFYSNIYFWKTSSYFAASAELKPLLHTWSLAVEEQYYIVFPALMLLIARAGASARRWLAVLLAASFGLSVWGVSRFPEATYYLLPTRGWELLLGAILALGIVPAPKQASVRELAGLAGLGMILWGALRFDATTAFPGAYALLPCFGATLVIWAGTSRVNRLLGLRPLVFVGLISYSLYLWHWPVIVFARYQGYFFGTTAQIAAVCLTSFGLAVLSWRFVETPFRTRSVLAARPLLLRAAGVGLASLLLMALSLDHIRPQATAGTVAVEQGRAEARAAYGEGTCFFSSDAPLSAIDTGACLRTDPGKPDYLLIGDSFAAHLWPGLEANLSDVNLRQLTFGGCPPLLTSMSLREPGCRKVTEAVFSAVSRTHYDVILMSARWHPDDMAALERTIRYLKPLADRIVLFGPIVEYRANLPEILKDNDRPHRVVAKYQIVPDVEDLRMENLAREYDLDYVSMIDLMCPGETCMIFDANRDPIQWDNGHLTPRASVQLMDRAKAKGEIPLL